jgi:hypothetical protein
VCAQYSLQLQLRIITWAMCPCKFLTCAHNRHQGNVTKIPFMKCTTLPKYRAKVEHQDATQHFKNFLNCYILNYINRSQLCSLMRSPCCLRACESPPPLTFECLDISVSYVYMCVCMYVMTSETISKAAS